MQSSHPETIFNPSKFFVPTPMINQLVEHLHSWLWNGVTGGYVVGDNRIGKTFAIKQMDGLLLNRAMEPIPVHYLSISRRDQNTVASVYKNLCLSLDMTPSSRTTADEMANDLLHYFAEAAIQNTTQQFVLFIDEFQRLHPRQLEVFAELYDKLAEAEINLCVIFVGNKISSKPLIDRILDPNNELIRGRFFTKSYHYTGITNHSDLKFILKAFDEKFMYQDKEISITNYFVGKHCQEDWKVTTLSTEIWEVFNEYYRRPLSVNSWGMQYFVATIKALLVDYLPRHGIQDKELVRDMIKESIEISGIVPDLVSRV